MPFKSCELLSVTSPPAGGRVDIENQGKHLRCAVLQLVYLRLMILQGSNIEIGGHGGLMVKRVAQRLFLSAMGQLAFQSLQNLSEALIQESHGFIFKVHTTPRWGTVWIGSVFFVTLPHMHAPTLTAAISWL